MAHHRQRFLKEKLQKHLTRTPCVSLLGMRQSGKTTLIKELSSSYLTLDDDKTLSRFSDGSWANLDSAKPPVAIDECQKLPSVFDHVKLLIDQKKQVGRFILTGSVRFLSKRQIKESLTGRTLVLELLPLTIAESHNLKLNNFIEKFQNAKSFDLLVKDLKHHSWATQQNITHHLELGGLPGICFKRDQSFRLDLFEQHLDTLISRDLPMIYQTKISAKKLKSFIHEIALNQGLPFKVESAAKKLNISGPTLRNILNAFEALFLIRNLNGRYYIEDAGLSHFIVQNELLSKDQLLKTFLFREILALFKYKLDVSYKLTDYTTRGGVEVPFVIHSKKGTIAITVDADDTASEKSIKSLGKFKTKKKDTRCIALHWGKEAYQSSTGTWCIPMNWIL